MAHEVERDQPREAPHRLHLVVVGLMGAGKSTVAGALAPVLGRPWRDSDADIERLTGRSGRDIAADGDDGVDELHRLEEAVLLGALAGEEPLVIAAAGWVVESELCRRALARRAVVVWLEVAEPELERRMATGAHRRTVSRDELSALVARRSPMLRSVADLVVDGAAAPADIVASILGRHGHPLAPGGAMDDAGPVNDRPRGIPEIESRESDAAELPIEGVRAFTAAAFTAAGMAPEDAATMADNFLWADLRGVDTHGVQRLTWYLRWFEKGMCDPRAQMSVIRELPTLVSGDGHSGLGQLVATRFMERMIPKAAEAGLCLGTLRNSNDWGCGGWYPHLAAQAGLACVATTTSVPNLAPYGSRTKMFGNNPIAFAFPRREGSPILLDMALTPVALGKVLRAQAEGTTLPPEWGFKDRDGNPTVDPATAMAGIVPAIGGYKGTGLAMITNILAGVISGSAHTGAVDVGKRGQFFLVMDPAVIHPDGAEAYFDAMEDLVAQVRAADVLPGESVFLPGEPEQLRLEARTAAGVIPYPGSVIDGLRKTADKLGLVFDLV